MHESPRSRIARSACLATCSAAGFLLVLAFLAAWPPAKATTEEPAPRPLILLTNDDGVSAPGLHAVAAALSRMGDVVIAAPARNSSGSSQSLQLGEVIRVRKLETPPDSGLTVHAIDGPPATCVVLALEHLIKGRKVDIVVSGINRGQNVGLDVGMSGTVGAARMAADLGLPAIAFSLALGSKDLETAASRAAAITAEALERKLATGSVLCVNFPRHPAAEWKRPLVTVPAGRGFRLAHELLSSAGPDSVYDPQMPEAEGPFPDGSDTKAIAEGHVSVCPLGTVAGGAAGAGALRQEVSRWRSLQ